MLIDTAFDFRSDTAPGKDPDTYSRTLGSYHRALWSKPLPNGKLFLLAASAPPVYLHHQSELGEFWLSSDTVMHTYRTFEATQSFMGQIEEPEHEAFMRATYTIGAMMVWPANKIDGRMTINGAKGFNRRISDRFDLTLECVRRYYLGQDSPLNATFARYASFFALFEDLRGFVDFFLLHDLVTKNYSGVRFLITFDDFKPPAIPPDLRTYCEYRRRSIEFIEARNSRINQLQTIRREVAGQP